MRKGQKPLKGKPGSSHSSKKQVKGGKPTLRRPVPQAKKTQPPNRASAQIPKTKAKPALQRDVKPKHAKTRPEQLTPSQQIARARGLAAINRVRKGQSKSLSAAARAEGTTVRAIQKLLPGALAKPSPDGRIRVKAGDTYSARVEILTATGPLVVTAHGSHERDLAGFYRAVIFRVLAGKEPAASLRQFRGKKVGGHKLISDFNQLHKLALAGAIGQLESLYASPEVNS
jgi:hypothetical protein